METDVKKMSDHFKPHEKSIEELVKILTINYCDNSLNLDENKDILLKNVIPAYEHKDDYEPHRVILVVGAGASKSAYPDEGNMLTGKELINELREKLLVESLVQNQTLLSGKYKEIEERFRLVYQLEDHKDFESTLALLSNYYTSDTIRGHLKTYFNHRYKPSLLYELIAHMFKHRFIDVIINFNFDEMLDQAIDEEMLGGDYHYIYSDGHCRPIDQLTTNGRVKAPIYIKPHGTISHPSSLRFTKDDYFTIPYDIKNTMYELVAGRISAEQEIIPKIKKTIIITLGYAMQSLEFNDILYRAIIELETKNNIKHDPNKDILLAKLWKDKPCEGLQIFHLNRDNKIPPSAGKNLVSQRINQCGYRFHEKTQEIITINDETQPDEKTLNDFGWTTRGIYCNSTEKKKSLANIMKMLWGEIELKFTANSEGTRFTPRSINRHIIIDKLFHVEFMGSTYRYPLSDWKPDHLDKNLGKYAESRTIVELLIALAKTKGRIDLTQLARERVGIYYEVYRTEKNKLYEIPKSLSKICEELGLARPHSLSNSHGFPDDVFSLSTDALKTPDSTVEKLTSILKHHFSPVGMLDIDEMKEYFKSITLSFSNDIRPKFKGRRLISFSSYNSNSILHTNLALKHKIITNLKHTTSWDVLLLISENGNTLISYEDVILKKDQPFHFHCILASQSITDHTKQKLENLKKFILKDNIDPIRAKHIAKHIPRKDGLDIVYDSGINELGTTDKASNSNEGQFLYLPYWLHHHHMILFLRDVDPIIDDDRIPYLKTGWDVRGAIYYQKDGMSTLINPIWIQPTSTLEKNSESRKNVISDDNRAEYDFMRLLEIYYLYRAMSVKQEAMSVKQESYGLNEVIHNDYFPTPSITDTGETMLREDTLSWLSNLKESYHILKTNK